MIVPSILQKLDILEYQTELTDVTSLAEGLVQLQHRRYPHLVPMYRTVHRTVPRKMTFRAIRWVNSERMFPGSGLSEQEMRDMTPEQREKLIVDLNTYREEAFVIHNRYNQMISMIELGKKPYFIPYANIPEDRWMTMQDYMDRAERLKDGTMAWEHALDVQADTLRRVLREEDDKRLDDIDGLWIGPDGEARAPMFMDIKQKRGQVPMRRERTIKGPDGNIRLKVVPKAFPRLFIAVHPDEVREGEKNRLPPEGQYLNPEKVQESQRELADAVGDAGFLLLRMPKVPFQLGTAGRKHLRDNGQFISAPAGRGNHPVQMFFDNVPPAAVANRRWNRITQPERGGRHDPDAPFSGPEGQHRRPERDEQAERDAEEDRGAVQEAQRNKEAREKDIADNLQPGERPPGLGERVSEARRRRAARDQDNAARAEERRQRNAEKVAERRKKEQEVNEQMAARDGRPSTDLANRLQQYNVNRGELLQKWGADAWLLHDVEPGYDPTKSKLEKVGFTGGGKSEGNEAPSGEGVRSDTNFTVKIDGKNYIYKVVNRDSRGEMFGYMLDRALGLNIMPSIHMANFGVKNLREAYQANFNKDMEGPDPRNPGGDAIQYWASAAKEGMVGGGHLMEFCDNCFSPHSNQGKTLVRQMFQSQRGRSNFFAQGMLDFFSGNPDRHAGNWLIHKDGRLVMIDNAFGGIGHDPEGGPLDAGDAGKRVPKGVGQNGRDNAGELRGGLPGAGDDWGAPPRWRGDIDNDTGVAITKDSVKAEVEQFWDDHFNAERVAEAANAVDVDFTNLNAVEDSKKKYVARVMENLRPIFSNLRR